MQQSNVEGFGSRNNDIVVSTHASARLYNTKVAATVRITLDRYGTALPIND